MFSHVSLNFVSLVGGWLPLINGKTNQPPEPSMKFHCETDDKSDCQLIELSLSGDKSAFGKIVERHQSLVCSVAYNRCGDLAISEDLAQEAFVVAWQKLADLNETTKFKPWICTIVRNLASRKCQQDGRGILAKTIGIQDTAELTAETEPPDNRLISQEQEQLVWQALADIPEHYREPMILFYREEQSVARVAEALELSQDAVKQRLSRGRKLVQAQLAATVETVLTQSKPSELFTSVVVLGLPAAKAKATAAAVAGATAKGSLAAGFGSAWIGALMQLPVFVWLLKTSMDHCRSDRERALTLRFYFFSVLGLIPLAVGFAVLIWWQPKFESPWHAGLVCFALLTLGNLPNLWLSRRLGKKIEQLRLEEHTTTPPLQLANAQDQFSDRAMPLFCGSSVLIAIWPAIAAITTGNWLAVAALLATAIVIGVTGAMICRRLPAKSLPIYATTLGSVVLLGLGFMTWQRWLPENDQVLVNLPTTIAASLEEAERVGERAAQSSLHFMWICMGMGTTNVVLAVLAWKRLEGPPASESK